MAIRDFIFPLALKKHSSLDELSDILGTGFLIGNKGFALTAAHVLPADSRAPVIAMYWQEDGWYGYAVTAENHPSLDVAILAIPDGPSRTPFRCRNKWAGSSTRYKQFGYPSQVTWEMPPNEAGCVLPRPDLIYFEGYIRRRVSSALAIKNVKGAEFFEVSEQAGRGCSGSPLFVHGRDKALELIGIYVADRTIDNLEGERTALAYAIREDAFRHWKPNLLEGKSILEESLLVDLTVD